MGKASREKGKRGEREWAKWLNENLGLNARRGVQHAGGPDSPDVRDGIPNTHAEVKRVESLNVHAALRQSIDESGESEVPYVAHRRNNQPWLITLRAEDLVAFCESVVATKDLVTTSEE